MNRIAGGPCSIVSDILVIGAEDQDKPGLGRQKFFNTLSELQPWDLTIAWCRGSVLRKCSDLQQEEPGIIAGLRKRRRARLVFDYSLPSPEKRPELRPKPSLETAGTVHCGEIAAGIFRSGWITVKKIWQRVRAGEFRVEVKWLNRNLVLFVIAVLLGLAAAYYIAEEGFHWPHGFKKHHHKHHEH